jgi:hypothetical protein
VAGKKRTSRGGGAGRKKDASWTKATEEIFFIELANICNVAAAARAAGFEDGAAAYKRKHRNAEFRTRYYAAIDEGYDRLELEMLERSRFGENRPADVGEADARQRAVPTPLALQLLKQHAAHRRARPEAAPAARRPLRGKALRDRLEATLAEINRRLGGNG